VLAAFTAAMIGLCMIVLTSLINYEILRGIWNIAPHLNIAPRLRVMLMVAGVFTGQLIAIWLYALLYWLLLHQFTALGSVVTTEGPLHEPVHDMVSLLYFSASSYSSLGYGDIVATGGLRILAGVQVLNGLVLIGWSASFTYLMMQKFWEIPHFSFRRHLPPHPQEEENHHDE